MAALPNYNDLLSQNQELKQQLEEANDAIEAIRTGQVDALIVRNDGEHELYTLNSADQTYRVFIEQMAEGAVKIDINGTILYSNNRFALMLDLPLEKVIGVSFKNFVPDDFKSVFDRLIYSGWQKETRGEISLLNYQNQLIPFLLSINPLLLNGEQSLSIILTDLTSQKVIEQQLKINNEELEDSRREAVMLNDELEDIVKEQTRDLLLSREHFKFLADNIPVIVWTATPDGTMDYYNQRWYDYTGLNYKQSISLGWEPVLHPDDYENVITSWSKAVASGEPFEVQCRFKNTENGQYRWHLGYAISYRDENNQIVKWFGTNTDIQDQKQEMEKRDEFIGVASHELKTPLTSAKGYIQLINSYQKETLPLPIKSFVKKAIESINKLQTLVNDLLDVSKIQAGKLEFSTEKFNLNTFISSSVENATHIYPNAKIINSFTGNFVVTGNIERLEQVLMNLINNAVKYSNNQNPIYIDAARTDGHVKISVTDGGIGLTEAQMERIFERFYRVEDKKFLTSGLGIGLYISSEIVKAHQGFMSVSSKFNEGSTFSFSLPLHF